MSCTLMFSLFLLPVSLYLNYASSTQNANLLFYQASSVNSNDYLTHLRTIPERIVELQELPGFWQQEPGD